MNKLVLGMVAVMMGVMLILGMTFISYNNSFATMEEDLKGKWAQVENQMKRRADLIPNLVNTVKGFASHEKEVFGKIAEARSQLMNAGSVPQKIEANNQLSGALGRLLMVAERYPDLKSDKAFSRLMDELAGTENRIAVERKRYNESVQSYNTSLRQLPGGLIAGVMGFSQATYFEVATADKATPTVKF